MMSLLRMAIGWHFLREGVIKLANPNWTAAGYLRGSWGPFAPLFNSMAESAQMMQFIDFIMPIALTVAGLGLILGLFTRTSSVIGMGLLGTFYVAAPPFEFAPLADAWAPFKSSVDHAVWAGQHQFGAEGNYYFVNKNLIEFLALAVICTLHPAAQYGLDAVISPLLSGEKTIVANAQTTEV